MSDFSEIYGLLFIGIVIVFLFIAVYKIVQNNEEYNSYELSSMILASKFRHNNTIHYSGEGSAFCLPDYNSTYIGEICYE